MLKRLFYIIILPLLLLQSCSLHYTNYGKPLDFLKVHSDTKRFVGDESEEGEVINDESEQESIAEVKLLKDEMILEAELIVELDSLSVFVADDVLKDELVIDKEDRSSEEKSTHNQKSRISQKIGAKGNTASNGGEMFLFFILALLGLALIILLVNWLLTVSAVARIVFVSIVLLLFFIAVFTGSDGLWTLLDLLSWLVWI